MSPAKTIEPIVSESITPLQMIQAAIEKGIDPDKLMAFAERYERNRAVEAFGRAITKFQSLCPRITKNRTASIQPRDGSKSSFNYEFSGFDDIDKVIRPLLIECGLAISFSTEDVPGKGIKGPAASGMASTSRIRPSRFPSRRCPTPRKGMVRL